MVRLSAIDMILKSNQILGKENLIEIDVLSTEFWAVSIQIYENNFCRFDIFETLPDALSHYHKAILLQKYCFGISC